MSDTQRAAGYDVIGDVHGHAAALVELLATMGYAERDGAWRHDTRQAVFVGDLIDRGPAQLDCYRIARAMVDAGSAHIVAGNHEFNAAAFHTPDPDRPGTHLRPHSDKNRNQHQTFLDQVGEGSRCHDEIIDWFSTLPLWFERDGLRVVHACWDAAAIAVVGDRLSPGLVEAASRKGSAEYEAIETLLKGPEIPIPVPYRDKEGTERHRARFAWWEPEADRLPVAAVIPGPDGPTMPDDVIDPPVAPYRDEVPVVYGHYWRSGPPAPSGRHTACVDYSVAKGGPLVAYRWSGESTLSGDAFVSAGGPVR
ncbi:MAG: metallophosphoesterase [Acidimicrobiales bacterium]|nr:metallophosphoesterase [Acidimicrobiales bacterium]